MVRASKLPDFPELLSAFNLGGFFSNKASYSSKDSLYSLLFIYQLINCEMRRIGKSISIIVRREWGHFSAFICDNICF